MKVIVTRSEETMLLAVKQYLDRKDVEYFLDEEEAIRAIPRRGHALFICGWVFPGSVSAEEVARRAKTRNPEVLVFIYDYRAIKREGDIDGSLTEDWKNLDMNADPPPIDGHLNTWSTEKTRFREMVHRAFETNSPDELRTDFPELFEGKH